MQTSPAAFQRHLHLAAALLTFAVTARVSAAVGMRDGKGESETIIPPLSGEVFAPQRLAALPPLQRAAWREYLDRSAAQRKADQDILTAELHVTGLPDPMAAPAGIDFKFDGTTPDSWYVSAAAQQIADAIVSFQTPAGGWSKAVAFTQGPRRLGMLWISHNEGWSWVGTFDNNATTTEMRFLARYYQSHRNPKYAAAVSRGLDYIFAAQMPNGGWPQVYPLEGSYHDEVTFNDDMTAHVLETLRSVANGDPTFAFVDGTRRKKAQGALAAAVPCLLKSQFVENGRLAVWGAQIDPLTYAPAAARKYEVACLTGGESLGIVRFLMGIDHPGPGVIRAIQGAVQWYRDSKISGLEYVKKADPNLPKGFDRVVQPNPEASPLWARFYELGTNRPIFVGRDSIVKYSLAEIELERRTGYAWYSGKPIDLLEKDYLRWQAKWASKPIDSGPR